MQVVSGALSRQKIHYEAPPALLFNQEMKLFLNWFNAKLAIDPMLKAGLDHLWFITLHPFDDGNDRMARAIGDRALAVVTNGRGATKKLRGGMGNDGGALLYLCN